MQRIYQTVREDERHIPMAIKVNESALVRATPLGPENASKAHAW